MTPCPLTTSSFATTLGALFGQQNGMNIRQDATGRNRDIAQQLVQFFVILDGQRNVTGNDATFFIIPGRVAGQFQDFGAQVLQHGGQIDGRTRTHARRVLALTNVATNATDGELKSGLGAATSRRFLFATATLALALTTSG